MKLNIIRKILPAVLLLTAVGKPAAVRAEEDTAVSSAVPSLEERSGISAEQMQNDFQNQSIGEGMPVDGEASAEQIVREKRITDQYIYLSDRAPDASSKAGWGNIQTDRNVDGGSISLKIDGADVIFEKGMGAHATSNLIYDIRDVKNSFPRLSTYAGIDSGKVGKSDGVSFYIWGGSSASGKWTELASGARIRPEDNAYYFDVNVSAYDFIRLEARVEGNNFSDHALYGDLRLLREDYDVDAEYYRDIRTTEEYDREISSRSPEQNFNAERLTVLRREFVSRIGYQTVQSVYRYHPEKTGAALDWILNDQTALQLFIEAGGYFSGSGYNALRSLVNLYHAHGNDVSDPMLEKMLLATAAAYSKNSKPFIVNYGGNYEISDPVVKYELMKQLYQTGRFVRQEEFEKYPMELVRMVMDTKINDSEILWLRDYIDKKYPTTDDWRRFNGYGYASYVSPNYSRSDFYDEALKDSWDRKYGFLSYGIPYGEKNLYRIWMLMENGSICWGLAGLGIVVNELQGIASVGTYQPGHEAFLTYSTDALGRGIWKTNDDIAGWGRSFTRWGSTTATEYRLPLEWGVRSYNTLNSGCNTSYILLAQNAFNEYGNYVDSMIYSLIANSFASGSASREEVFEKALDCYSRNLDALYGIYESMAADAGTSDREWSELARRVIDEYTYFPAPMADLLRLIRKEMDEEVNRIELDVWRAEALAQAAAATSEESLQDTACRQVAQALLGSEGKPLAQFSFDGEKAGMILMNEDYSESAIQVRVSLDNGNSWEIFENGEKFTAEHEIMLRDEQIARINADDDILVGLMGTETNYRIDIQKGADIPSTVFFNDQEDMLFGAGTERLEYSLDGGNSWKNYVSAEGTVERIIGDAEAVFRTKPYGTVLLGKEKTYRFTKSSDPDTRKYVYVSHLKLHSFSSQTAADKAEYIIDGNDLTGWHTNTSAEPADYPRTAVIELDRVRFISAIEYMSSFTNGKLKRAEIDVSLDGVSWTKVMTTPEFRNDSSVKKIEFPEPAAARYVRFHGAETYGHLLNTFFTCRTLSFYEDTTKNYAAEPVITYSETEPTQNDVRAILTLPYGCTAEETEYLFTDNGTHTFFFRDANGTRQQVNAEVSWIDRTAPEAEIVYSTANPTNGDVVASLQNFSEENTEVISEGGLTHTFRDNGTFTFVLRDRAGNEGHIEASVDWIDRTAPVLGVTFDCEKPTSESVTAVLNGYDEEDTILGDGKSEHVFEENGEHVFIVQDPAGNRAELPVKVSWIDREAPAASVSYSTEQETDGPVTARLTEISEPVTFIDGSEGIHEFTENGTYLFVIEDLAGNRTEVKAEVSWIRMPETEEEEDLTVPFEPQEPVHPAPDHGDEESDGGSVSVPSDPEIPSLPEAGESDTAENPENTQENKENAPAEDQSGKPAENRNDSPVSGYGNAASSGSGSLNEQAAAEDEKNEEKMEMSAENESEESGGKDPGTGKDEEQQGAVQAAGKKKKFPMAAAAGTFSAGAAAVLLYVFRKRIF